MRADLRYGGLRLHSRRILKACAYLRRSDVPTSIRTSKAFKALVDQSGLQGMRFDEELPAPF